MKNILNLILLLIFSLGASAQSVSAKKEESIVETSGRSVQDSIDTFYKELFKALKIGYLHRKSVDWKSVEPETYKRLATYKSFKTSLNEISTLFDKINATHCLVYRREGKYSATHKVIAKDRYSAQWKKKYDTRPAFEVKVLQGKYGYILVPGMVFFDNSAENISRIAQPLYEQIAQVKNNDNIEGWIVDLRFNTGGNAAPMLLALYDLLGDHDIWGELNVDKRSVSKYKLDKGNYIQKSKVISSVSPNGRLLDQAKVAVITGLFTGSSGEITALAFKGRANTRFIGENTASYTTGNVSWPLPFNTTMALTTGYDSDRNGIYYDYIVPDVAVSKQDNFDDLSLDGNIIESIKFIKGG
ncbi:S41 family peptidase [Pedobacter sp. BMA]|uniref:S41 family peptidase n=1 Tax=Pedobacter sp. BMA TaxID=1663685 RepID=UPI00064AA3D6|nr:S41 family peptidase [Pedobacter sp. BMA]KLT63972.1 peptidase S41 protein [Pedobacter sp. BMA]